MAFIMANDRGNCSLQYFRFRCVLLVPLLSVILSCSVTRTTTVQTELVVHHAENIILPEADMPLRDDEVVPEEEELMKAGIPVKLRIPGPAETDIPNSVENDKESEKRYANDTDLQFKEPEKRDVDDADLQFYERYSKRIGIPLDGTENKELIMAIAKWLGAPFKWGGCSIYGVDCSCFVKLVYKDVYGIKLRRTSRSIFHNDVTPIQKHDLEEGDIISFKIKGDKISHIGIYLKDNKFVHVSRSKGVKINSLAQRYYKKRFFSAGRVTDMGQKAIFVATSPDRPSRLSGRIKLKKLVVLGS